VQSFMRHCGNRGLMGGLRRCWTWRELSEKRFWRCGTWIRMSPWRHTIGLDSSCRGFGKFLVSGLVLQGNEVHVCLYYRDQLSKKISIVQDNGLHLSYILFKISPPPVIYRSCSRKQYSLSFSFRLWFTEVLPFPTKQFKLDIFQIHFPHRH